MDRPLMRLCKACVTCGKEFSVKPCKAAQKYCSRECMRRSPHKPLKGVYKICPTCNKEFYLFPALASRVYCSRACMTIAYQRMYGLPPKICPACGKEFKPGRSNQVHCSPECVHVGQRNANALSKSGHKRAAAAKSVDIKIKSKGFAITKTCEQCGATFEVTVRQNQNQKFCSHGCHQKSRAVRITKICKGCGKLFGVRLCVKDRARYCSRTCREQKIEKVCEYCGKTFYITRTEAEATGNRARKTCSRSCLARLRVQNGTSPFQNKETRKQVVERMLQRHKEDPTKHPWYIDGSFAGGSHYRGANWTQQKRAARERDNFTCQRCGKLESELSRHLSVHHKIPYRFFASSCEANVLDNLICYCQSCHKKIEIAEAGWLIALFASRLPK